MPAISVAARLPHRAFSGRKQLKLDDVVRIALRMGIFQLRYLDRIPAHAAVAESVELVKQAHKRSAAGFVNAVLRKVNRSPIAWPDQATELSLPAWMLERWQQQYGRRKPPQSLVPRSNNPKPRSTPTPAASRIPARNRLCLCSKSSRA